VVKTITRIKDRTLVERQSTDLIVAHTMEAPERPQVALDVAKYFDNVLADSQWCVDSDTRVQVIPDSKISWTTPGVNHRSYNIEMAGYARQSEHEWADKYSLSTLDNSALCAAEAVFKYNIPIRKLTQFGLRAGLKGFIGHVDATYVYRKSTHTDPGKHFPWKYYLSLVRSHHSVLIGGTPRPIAKPPKKKRGKIDVDGRWGRETTNRLQQVLRTTRDGVVSNQQAVWKNGNSGLTVGWDWTGVAGDGGSAVILAHQRVLAKRRRYHGKLDGKVGPKYFLALQRDLGTVADGEIWNPSRAVVVLQRRLNKGKV
jgi:hypothetical protein